MPAAWSVVWLTTAEDKRAATLLKSFISSKTDGELWLAHRGELAVKDENSRSTMTVDLREHPLCRTHRGESWRLRLAALEETIRSGADFAVWLSPEAKFAKKLSADLVAEACGTGSAFYLRGKAECALPQLWGFHLQRQGSELIYQLADVGRHSTEAVAGCHLEEAAEQLRIRVTDLLASSKSGKLDKTVLGPYLKI